jgi:hypothetical protein
MSEQSNNQTQEQKNPVTSILITAVTSAVTAGAKLAATGIKALGAKISLIIGGILLIVIIIIVCAVAVVAGMSAIAIETKKKAEETKNTTNNYAVDFSGLKANNKNTITLNGITFYIPIAKPKEKNVFYALSAIRFAEARRPDSVYQPNDFLSCGNYQQLINELLGNSGKAQVAKDTLKEKYQTILEVNKTDIERWYYKGINNIMDGEIEYRPIYTNDGFVGYARTVPDGIILICKALTEIHLETGLFDKIAIIRLKERGVYDYVINYDLRADNLNNFVYTLCKSQGAADCGYNWNIRALGGLREALNNNLYESVNSE